MWPDNWKRMWKNSPIDQDNVVTSNLVLWILDFLASLSAIETEQMGGMSPLCILEKAESPVKPTCIINRLSASIKASLCRTNKSLCSNLKRRLCFFGSTLSFLHLKEKRGQVKETMSEAWDIENIRCQSFIAGQTERCAHLKKKKPTQNVGLLNCCSHRSWPWCPMVNG